MRVPCRVDSATEENSKQHEQTGGPPLPDDADSKFTQTRKRGWAHFIQKVWMDDPERCEKCDGTMKIVAEISSPRQDDVIRAILESTGQWDPPWDRRGPPPASSSNDENVDQSQPCQSYDPTVELGQMENMTPCNTGAIVGVVSRRAPTDTKCGVGNRRAARQPKWRIADLCRVALGFST